MAKRRASVAPPGCSNRSRSLSPHRAICASRHPSTSSTGVSTQAFRIFSRAAERMAFNTGASVAGTVVRGAVESGLAIEVACEGVITAAEAIDDLTHKQPKRDKVEKLAKKLAKKVNTLEKRFAELSRDIVSLREQLRGLGYHRLVKRKQIISDLHRNLVLKYGFVDFIDILFDKIDNDRELSYEEIDFFNYYKDYIKSRIYSDIGFEHIERFVMSLHDKDISNFINCDIGRTLKLLRSYGRQLKPLALIR